MVSKISKKIETQTKTVNCGEQVKHGVTLVSEIGISLAAIVGRVKEIDREVEAIVKASQDQMIGIKEINHAVNRMDQSTQDRTEIVAKSATASNSLTETADALFNLLG